MLPESELDCEMKKEEDATLHEECEHVATDNRPTERILEVILSKHFERVRHDLVASHVNQTATQAVLRQQEEHLSTKT